MLLKIPYVGSRLICFLVARWKHFTMWEFFCLFKQTLRLWRLRHRKRSLCSEQMLFLQLPMSSLCMASIYFILYFFKSRSKALGENDLECDLSTMRTWVELSPASSSHYLLEMHRKCVIASWCKGRKLNISLQSLSFRFRFSSKVL